MKIEVLGTGCFTCLMLEAMVKETAARLGLNAEVSHVYDIEEIIERGVMMTPALAIDGKLKISGKLPSKSELERLIKG